MEKQLTASLTDVSTVNHFRLNPFRILNVPIEIDEEEAGWTAEKLITLTIAQIPNDKPDLLGYLTRCSETEIRHAVSLLEEPLERLTFELFWFYFKEDPNGEQLNQALNSNDPLSLFEVRQQISAKFENDLTKHAIAELVNFANLELLISILLLNSDQGSSIIDLAEFSSQHENLQPFNWVKKRGFAFVENPHLLIGSVPNGPPITSAAFRHLSKAFSLWSTVVTSDGWSEFINEKLDRLQDDLLDESTPELLRQIISNRLYNILADEIKYTIQHANYNATNNLLEIISENDINLQLFRNALASTKILFQNDISQAYEAISDNESNTLENFRVYFRSIQHLNKKWQFGDHDDLLGARSAIDHAISQGFRLLSKQEFSVETYNKKKDLFDLAESIAHSSSLKEYISNQKDQLTEALEFGICHFCKLRPADKNFPLVLSGKKYSHSDYNKRYYNIKYGTVPRCLQCADIHQFNESWALNIMAVTLIFPGIFCIYRFDSFIEFGGLGVAAGVGILIGWAVLVSMIFKNIIEDMTKPAGNLRSDQVEQTSEYLRLSGEGFTVSRLPGKKALETILNKQK